MMNKPQASKSANLEFLSPEGQLRRDAMRHELTAELGKVQTQRRTRRRINAAVGTAILLVAITTGTFKFNYPQPVGSGNHHGIQKKENHGPNPQPHEKLEQNKYPDSAPASYITRTPASKSTRWEPASTATIKVDRLIKRVQNDDELLELLQQVGYESVGLIRTENRVIISGNTAAFKTAKPTVKPPVTPPVPPENKADESKTGTQSTTSGILDFNA